MAGIDLDRRGLESGEGGGGPASEGDAGEVAGEFIGQSCFETCGFGGGKLQAVEHEALDVQVDGGAEADG